jgi:hypothetical protein
MEINRTIVDSLKSMGLTAKELTEYINVIKEEEEQLARAKKEKENAIRQARQDFAESLLVYLLRLDIITEEDIRNSDLNLFMQSIERMEQDIFEYIELFKVPELDVAIKKAKKEKETLTTAESLKEDFKVIEDWLASLGI